MAEPTSPQTAKLSSLVFGDGTPRKALATALFIGTLLTAINHGDTILLGQFPPMIKVLLPYFVPYCVTTWGAVTGKLAQARRHNQMLAKVTDAKVSSS